MKRLDRRKKRVLKLLIFLIFLLFLLLLFLWYYAMNISPILASIGLSKSKYVAVNAISDAVNETMTDENVDYEDIAILEKNDRGDIIAIKTDIVKLNRIQADLAKAINNKTELDEIDIYVPIGNIIDSRRLTGWGPKIKFRLIPNGGITTKIDNLFTSAGINQTRHQVMLTIRVDASILMPLTSESTVIETSICIAETVLVGNVPSTYVSTEDPSGISINPKE